MTPPVMDSGTDWNRIRHLLKIGIAAALTVLAGDMLLGWGVSDPSVTSLPTMFTRYLSVSDGRIFASAVLGLVGIPVECLSWFAIYRLIRPFSEKNAHAYRRDPRLPGFRRLRRACALLHDSISAQTLLCR